MKEQKSAVITGGNGVLGGAIAKKFASEGMVVGILGRTAGTVEHRVEEIKELGGKAIGLVADVLDEDSLVRVRKKMMARTGRIDVLVNAAGGNMKGAIIEPDQNFFDLSIEAFSQVTDLNLKGTVLPSMVFGKVMADQRKGSIINISSMASQQAISRVMGYSAAKAGIDNFTKWLAVEMTAKFGEGIRINAIAPGFFIGDQNRDLLLNPDGSLTARGELIIANTPMKRFGRAEEIGGVAYWLSGDEATFVTGIVVPVDGGFSAFSGV